jgi:hypothetical protein
VWWAWPTRAALPATGTLFIDYWLDRDSQPRKLTGKTHRPTRVSACRANFVETAGDISTYLTTLNETARPIRLTTTSPAQLTP